MSKKRMEDLSNKVEIPHFAKSFSERAGHIASWKDGYLAGMSDPEANGELLKECEKFLEEIIVICEDYSLYGTKTKTEDMLKKLREARGES